MQRLKLFHTGDVERYSLINGHVSAECCTGNLSDAEVDLLNSCFDNSSVTITETERSSLYYICGYVAHKENGMIMDPIVAENNSASEFTKMVSRGRLSFPTEELFDLSLYLYGYYKSVEDIKCTTRLINAFDRISDFTKYQLPNQKSVLQRFANCFGKAFAMKISDSIKS